MLNGDDTKAICDFCGDSPVVKIRTIGPTRPRFFDGFPVDIKTDAAQLLEFARLRQPWYTCEHCEAIVETRDRTRLLQRASDVTARTGGPNAKILDFPLALMQAAFWAMLSAEKKFAVLDYVAAPARTAFKLLAGSERRDFRLPSGNFGIERWLPNETALHLGFRAGSLWLITVRAREPGRGRGSDTMRRIIAIADADSTAIELRAQKYGPPEWQGPDESCLVRWYERFGFKSLCRAHVAGESGTWMRRESQT